MLNKLNTSPRIRRQIRAWLKSGVIEGKQLFPTLEGTPQGGVISPLLANIALHGMEERIKQFAQTLDMKNCLGRQQGKTDKRSSLSLIRYADDFVILHEDITVVQQCQRIISQWLYDIGLELKPSKTRITHTLVQYGEEKPGFDFLGFNIRQFPVGKTHSKQGFKTIITPSEEKVKAHYDQIASIIESHKTAPQKALISRLNPVIRGWSNYYSTVVSKDTYADLDNLVFQKLRAWANRRHPKKNGTWVSNKYWMAIDSKSWLFATKFEGFLYRLARHDSTAIERHVKVQSNASPYDGNLVYWSARLGKNPEMPNRVSKLLKRQRGKCTHCAMYFCDGNLMEVDHIIPKSKGGKDEYQNLQLLHRHCHDQKTANDGSLRYT
jgi:RNA-directed DNA polymerase